MKQKQMTNQYKDVDERFDKEFTCIVTYEKWPDEEEQRLREPQYKFKDFPNTNPKMVKSFIHQELEEARREVASEIYKLITPESYETPDRCFSTLAEIEDRLASLTKLATI